MSGWSIRVGIGDIPFADYDCPNCRTQTSFELHGNGSVPNARCCAKRELYPIHDERFAKHLLYRRSATADVGGVYAQNFSQPTGKNPF